MLKVSTAEAAAAAAALSTPKAKQSRTTAVAAAIEAAKGEANNSMHGDIVGSDTRPTEAPLLENHQAGPPLPVAAGVTREAYEALQKELADLHQEMVTGEPLATRSSSPRVLAPACDHHERTDRRRGEVAPSALPGPLLRGDPDSTVECRTGGSLLAYMLQNVEHQGIRGEHGPSEFLREFRVYETAIKAAGGGDTTRPGPLDPKAPHMERRERSTNGPGVPSGWARTGKVHHGPKATYRKRKNLCSPYGHRVFLGVE